MEDYFNNGSMVPRADLQGAFQKFPALPANYHRATPLSPLAPQMQHMSPLSSNTGGPLRGQEGNSNIRVAVRLRPVLSEEAQRGQGRAKINIS